LLSKKVSWLILILLLVSVLVVVFYAKPVKAESGTIYIRADGSIEPSTASISTIDNVTYTFTGNIYGSIVVERNNTVIDGAGYTVQGEGPVDRARFLQIDTAQGNLPQQLGLHSFCEFTTHKCHCANAHIEQHSSLPVLHVH
jgi:hypothetical protein